VLPGEGALDDTDFIPEPKHPSVLERYRLEEAKVAHTEVYDIAANWKAIRENFLECYHCSTNHPQFTTAFDLRGQYDDDGRQTDDFPLKSGMCSLSMDGQPVSKRPFGDFVDVPPEQWTYTFAKAAPDFVLIANPDHVVVFGYTAVSVDRTVLKCDWLVHRDAVEGVDFETKNLVEVWHETNLQDIALCESAQRGMRSASFQPGPLSPLTEPDIFAFHRRYHGWLRDGALEPAA
jgi:Rieske 2Fe-2S family protein